MKKIGQMELLRLRFAVGYLGEQLRPAWWASSFFAPGSMMFLTPIFSKTSLIAQYHGIREAATRIHDERIGIGAGVFHLFRLPDAWEQELHQHLREPEIIEQLVKDEFSELDARNALECLGKDGSREAAGPVRIGGRKELEKIDSWRTVANYYKQAFATRGQVFPYFSEGK